MLKSQCGSHMCHDINSIAGSKIKHEVRDQVVHDNPYAIIGDIDFSNVNSCQPVNVNHVVRETEGETCHEASVLMKNGKKINLLLRNRVILRLGQPKRLLVPKKLGFLSKVATKYILSVRGAMSLSILLPVTQQ